MRHLTVFAGLAFLAVVACSVSAAVLQVGPTRTYTTVQSAVNAASAGDTIEIDSGTYVQSAGWATINKANLTIRGVGATRPILDADGSSLSGKAIFIVTAASVIIENLEFENCSWHQQERGWHPPGSG